MGVLAYWGELYVNEETAVLPESPVINSCELLLPLGNQEIFDFAQNCWVPGSQGFRDMDSQLLFLEQSLGGGVWK